MKLQTITQSGSLESSDILIKVSPGKKGAGRKIELESVVLNEFGQSITSDINAVLDTYDIKDVHMVANDRGALTPTIKARVEAAIVKSGKGEE
ncbi:citrate lyase acyl carrier protein [Thermoproteota archaeon]